MKNNRPSQIDLATLATHLPTGSPGERVDTALAIWQAAGKRLDDLAARTAQISSNCQKYDSEHDRVMQAIEFPPGAVSLQTFLAKTVPDKFPKAQRMEIFRQFLALKNPAMPRGVDHLPDIIENGIESPGEGFAFSFRRWLESYKAQERAASQKEKSEVASLARYGEKWTHDALAGKAAQMLEMLVSNTARLLKGDREKAKARVEILIGDGRIVTIDGKLYGIPGNEKSRPIAKKKRPAKK